jgi:hypothetical protein
MVLHHPLRYCLPLAGSAALINCGAGDPPPRSVEAVKPVTFESRGYLQAPGLNESSGVVASRRHRGLLWTHNDSGDDAVLYLTNVDGEDLGKLTLEGARARDWEDLTLGPCPDEDADCLYIADTGDNNRVRSRARIYVVKEPAVVPLVDGASSESRRINIYYPDRPFNIEAIAASPAGDLWMISKGLADTAIYTFKVIYSELTKDTIEVRPLGRLDFDPAPMLGQLVTGATISADGRMLAARTYTQIFLYEIDGDQLDRIGLCWLGPQEPQGEAIDFVDGDLLVLTSESETGGLAPINVVSCPILL